MGARVDLTQRLIHDILRLALGRRLTVGPEILDLVVQVRILAPQPHSHVRDPAFGQGRFFVLHLV